MSDKCSTPNCPKAVAKAPIMNPISFFFLKNYFYLKQIQVMRHVQIATVNAGIGQNELLVALEQLIQLRRVKF